MVHRHWNISFLTKGGLKISNRLVRKKIIRALRTLWERSPWARYVHTSPACFIHSFTHSFLFTSFISEQHLAVFILVILSKRKYWCYIRKDNFYLQINVCCEAESTVFFHRRGKVLWKVHGLWSLREMASNPDYTTYLHDLETHHLTFWVHFLLYTMRSITSTFWMKWS